jgi:HEAT repeat protein
MDCEAARRTILLHLYGEAPEAERLAAELHAAACASCRTAAAEERRLHALFAERAPFEPSEALLDRCRADLMRALDAEAGAGATAAVARGAAGTSPWIVRLAYFWRQVRLSPAYGFAMLAVGFLAGAVTLRAAPVEALRGRASEDARPAGAAAPAGAVDTGGAALANVQTLESAGGPTDGQVRLGVDTLQRASFEGTAADPRIRDLLVRTVRDNVNSGLRLEAIDALKAHADRDDVRQALLDAMRRDENPGARLKALDALASLAPANPQVSGAIVDLLQKDANPGVRVRAMDTLARGRDPRLLPVMERLSREDPDAYVRMRSGDFVDAMYASGRR